jgi:ubiquinone/menaquinone biosynthesis C-methylase UbiE
MDKFLNKLKSHHGGRILDVATSHGGFLRELTDTFAEFTEAIGIDNNPERIAEARKNSSNGLEFAVMDAEQLDFTDAYFDTVAMRHSLHHLPDPPKVLPEMSRVLKPGGLFIVGEVIQDPDIVKPNSYCHIHHWWAKADRARGKSHNETFTRDQVVSLLQDLELDDVQWFEYLDDVDEAEESEVVDDVIKRSEDFIETLREVRADKELIAEGEELIARLRSQGLAYDKILYLMARKPRN